MRESSFVTRERELKGGRESEGEFVRNQRERERELKGGRESEGERVRNRQP